MISKTYCKSTSFKKIWIHKMKNKILQKFKMSVKNIKMNYFKKKNFIKVKHLLYNIIKIKYII